MILLSPSNVDFDFFLIAIFGKLSNEYSVDLFNGIGWIIVVRLGLFMNILLLSKVYKFLGVIYLIDWLALRYLKSVIEVNYEG